MRQWSCPLPTCKKICRSPGGLTQHVNAKHQHHADFGKREKAIHRTCHPLLDGKLFGPFHVPLTNDYITGTPCDPDGYDLEPGTPPETQQGEPEPIWSPFHSQVQFETADFLFKKAEMSQGNIDILMELWSSTAEDGEAPFRDHREMLATIDAIDGSDAPWQSFTASYSGTRPPGDPPDWMLKDYTVFFRNPLAVVRSIISNPDFEGKFDYVPYMEFEDEKRRWSDLMSGEWAWKQAVSILYFYICHYTGVLTLLKDIISRDPDTHGSMMVPLVLGSDKTLASNATGLNEFHPLYISPGNVKNSVRRAHQDALIPIGFLAILKSKCSGSSE